MNILNRPTPHLLALLAFLAFFFILLQDIRHWSSRDPGSPFFDPDQAFKRAYSLERQAQAEAYVDNAEARGDDGSYVKAAQDHELCVGIATVQREGARYFKTAMGSVLAGLTEAERRDIYLMSFIVNVDPNLHQAYNETWPGVLSDEVLTYNDAPQELRKKVTKLEKTDKEFRRKPLLDYVYLLQKCYDTGAEWIVMLEDDTIGAEGWYTRTKLALNKLQHHRDLAKTVYLRLFYNERLLGWNSEEWLSYVVWSLFMETLLLGALLALARYLPNVSKALTPRTIFTIVTLCGPMLLGLYFAAGRLTVAGPSQGLHRMDTYGCCSQAFVFHRARIPRLVSHYEARGLGYIDVLTEEYAEEEGLARWALTPSVFQHVGGVSSKSTQTSKWGRNNAENIWNFAFEMFDQRDLRRQHFV